MLTQVKCINDNNQQVYPYSSPSLLYWASARTLEAIILGNHDAESDWFCALFKLVNSTALETLGPYRLPHDNTRTGLRLIITTQLLDVGTDLKSPPYWLAK